jgi:8-amino-7-oxononanoate synthase
MLGSNNYLGLAYHPFIREAVKRVIDDYGVGMGGPPLLNGMSDLHRQLELRLARLKGGEDALLFSSGYQANLGWVVGLLREGDILIYDELNHASLYDGVALAGAQSRAIRFRHNDCFHLEQLLRRFGENRTGQLIVAVEGVYSMDGDLAPIPQILKLCRKYGASLMVDDAHGTGVMGKTGAGTAEHFGVLGEIDIYLGTFSKAFGTTGGFIVARREVIDYLRFFARSYMFSAHLPPTTVATVLAGLEVIHREPERIARLHENAAYLEQGLNALNLNVRREAAILPVKIPSTIDLRCLNLRFHEEGIFLNPIEYPAVPKNEQRLRLSVMATHTKEDLDYALNVFKKLKKEFNF